MKRFGAILGAALMILSVVSVAVAVPAAGEADNPVPTVEDLAKDVTAVSQLAEVTRSQLDGYVERVVWIGGLSTIGLTILGYFGWSSLRESIRRVVDRNLEAAVGSALEESLPSVLSETQKRAESHLLRLSKILALHSYGAYDEALAEFGWNGHVSDLRSETAPLRRTLIDCLYSSKKDRSPRRDAAWEAITELVQDDDAPETNRLYLRLSISLRKHSEGLAFFERLKDPITSDKESALRSATLLRKVGRLTDALSLAESHADEDDLGSIVTVAVLQRDLGKFDEVHDVLRPAVNRLMSDPSQELPDGWHRIANTFVAIASTAIATKMRSSLQNSCYVVRRVQ